MKEVKIIPPPEYTVVHDPWLDKLLDGTLRELGPKDWNGRYKSARSAASAIHQAARKRDKKATVAIRGDVLYVQGVNGTTANGTSKAPAKRAPAKQAPAKKAAAKRTPAKTPAKADA